MRMHYHHAKVNKGKNTVKADTNSRNGAQSAWQVFLVFLRLGLTSFGGPVAHLGYFRTEFVIRRAWLSEQSYADLVALCQFLPGPASSQVGMAVGYTRAGYTGLAAAWLGFTLPSAVLLILFALGVSTWTSVFTPGLLHGLKLVAVAVVAQAVWGMARNLCQGRAHVTLMALVAGWTLLVPAAWAQVAAMLFAALVGVALFHGQVRQAGDPIPLGLSRRAGLFWGGLFLLLLIGLPWLAAATSSPMLAWLDVFYRAGSLVFGGGHVVLPLLQAEVVPAGWVGNDAFLAGYGAAQAVPGPLFTFAAFLGVASTGPASGWSGGLLATLAIFLPSFFLVLAALPFWSVWRENSRVQAALAGVNCGVVGLLVAALYNPVWVSAIHAPGHVALALAAWVALVFWNLPAWLVVAAGAMSGWVLLS